MGKAGTMRSNTNKCSNKAETQSADAREQARLLNLIFNDPDFDDFSLDSLVRAHLRTNEYLSSTQKADGSEHQTNVGSGDGGDHLSSVQSSTVNVREKLKETDEYKRSQEEEWTSRQQTIQIQAEEARKQKRNLKRERDKNSRLLDAQKRAKQRVAEIRNTEKKNEENMNLKEVIRAEIKKDLNKFEQSCLNMASLLQYLGVRIEGLPKPSSQEVRGAYKKALMKFHPDRNSSADMRVQVEAEEKIKLINRMKAKFPPL